MKRTLTSQQSNHLLERFARLAYNLWWTWNPEAQALFKELSPLIWELSNHNAVAVLKGLSRRELEFRLHDRSFAKRARKVLLEFESYVRKPNVWATRNAPKLKHPVAYFSAEFGLHESIPIYSGGLGVLSGDHVKSASDLGLPFVALGLFYREGYFRQRLAPDGMQYEEYSLNDPDLLPMELVQNVEGGRLLNSVEIGHSIVFFQTWKVQVGRVPLFLLDTAIPENGPDFQRLTGQVYGGDVNTRIGQEMILGIGGVRLLRSLDMFPEVFHMNEGHSAFLLFELLREKLAGGSSREEAEQAVRSQCIFTTHTPVPAGHDRFADDMMRSMFEPYLTSLQMTHEQFMGYGRIHPNDSSELFTMTVFALKMSRASNGVSELHGAVSRQMWKDLYPSVAVEKVPIGSITNGIHTPSWASERAHEFWNLRLGYDWTRKLLDRKYWSALEKNGLATDEELWGLRYALRRELIEFVRERLRHQQLRFVEDVDALFSPDALTICFARRFATYKRAPLLFRALEEVLPLFKNPERPIQMIFAGKSHPRDHEGKRFLQSVVEIARHPDLVGKIVVLENYDMNIARHLVAGADVWLNNPRRPLEASGTSGMKVLIHGGLNLSIMDGWWREAYNGTNGWSIGDDSNNTDMEGQDEKDFRNLLTTLQEQVIPQYYDRNEQGLPVRWINRIRYSMSTLLPAYNTERMVAEYVKKYYLRRPSRSILASQLAD